MQRGHIGGCLLGEAYGQEVRQVIWCTHISYQSGSLPSPAQHQHICQIVQVFLWICRGAFRRVPHCQRQAPDSGEANASSYTHLKHRNYEAQLQPFQRRPGMT